MKLLLLFDESVEYLNRKNYENALKGFDVLCAGNERDGDYSDFLFTHCIYLVSANTGVPRSQCETVLRNSHIHNWLIVMVTQSLFPVPFPPLRSKWDLALRKAELSYQIIEAEASQTCGIIEWVLQQKAAWNLIREDEVTDQKLCIVVSNRDYVGKTAFVQFLEKEHTGYYFKEIPASRTEEFQLYAQIAARIIYIGTDIVQFDFASLEQGRGRALFFLNKADKNPLYWYHKETAKELILKKLNSQGWNLAQGSTSRIRIGSVLLENTAERLNTAERNASENCYEKSFTLFDEFGLPLPHEAYTKERVLEFNRGNEVRKLVDYLKNQI